MNTSARFPNPAKCKVSHHFADHWKCIVYNDSCPYAFRFDDDKYCLHRDRRNFAE